MPAFLARRLRAPAPPNLRAAIMSPVLRRCPRVPVLVAGMRRAIVMAACIGLATACGEMPTGQRMTAPPRARRAMDAALLSPDATDADFNGSGTYVPIEDVNFGYYP
jgi:hypothetical protein